MPMYAKECKNISVRWDTLSQKVPLDEILVTVIYSRAIPVAVTSVLLMEGYL